jgi:hypothetical protein
VGYAARQIYSAADGLLGVDKLSAAFNGRYIIQFLLAIDALQLLISDRCKRELAHELRRGAGGHTELVVHLSLLQ